MAVFRDVLAVCELRDIRFTSFPYKYDNHQQGDRNVRVRLDRVCADDEWMARFQNAGLQHLTSSRSDHCPLLLRLQQPDPRPRSKSRRYEIMWEREPALPEIVSNTWEKEKAIGYLGVVAKSLRQVIADLHEWSKHKFGHVRCELEKLRDELAALNRMDADMVTIKQKMERMDELLYNEEIMWLQRSRMDWVWEGDRNTRYFQRRVVWRARKNLIRKFLKEDGTWCTVPTDMERMASSYF